MKSKEYLGITSARIADAVEKFLAFKRTSTEPRFYASDLRAYVLGYTNLEIAPGSSDRVMRNLRQRGKVNYQLLNRARSYYLALPLSTTKGATAGGR